jgi:hypothetical protein
MHVYSLVYYGLVFFSCSSSQPELYHGDANVVVSSDLYLGPAEKLRGQNIPDLAVDHVL